MFRSALALLTLLTLGFDRAQAQRGGAKTPPEKSLAVAGAQVDCVPELLYQHLKVANLKPGQGLVVQYVLPGSPAARAGLRRYDILLSFGGTTIRDSDHFLRLVEAVGAGEKVPVALVRNGAEVKLQVCLALAEAASSPLEASLAKGVIKPDGPPAVSVAAESLGDGNMRVTFIYSDGTGKLKHLTREGSLPAIEQQVRDLNASNEISAEVRELLDVALKRLRTLNGP
jgi:membrane-associated protease RseP (regulator of RpoE activity)